MKRKPGIKELIDEPALFEDEILTLEQNRQDAERKSRLKNLTLEKKLEWLSRQIKICQKIAVGLTREGFNENEKEI